MTCPNPTASRCRAEIQSQVLAAGRPWLLSLYQCPGEGECVCQLAVSPGARLVTHLPDLWPDQLLVPLGPPPGRSQRSLRHVAVQPLGPVSTQLAHPNLTSQRVPRGEGWVCPPGCVPSHVQARRTVSGWCDGESGCRPFCARLSMVTTNCTSDKSRAGGGQRRGKGEAEGKKDQSKFFLLFIHFTNIKAKLPPEGLYVPGTLISPKEQ